MRVSKRHVGRVIAALCMVAIASLAYAQATATSTFNGRVLDQGDAVLPGVTITATNVSTGVSRSTVTNAEGAYLMPGLEPGVYSIKTELSGFASSARQNISLTVNTTLTVDFKLALAGVNETLTVTGEAPLIEATQSKLATTIQTTELQNLPMLTRTISNMPTLRWRSDAFASHISLNSRSIGGDPVRAVGARGATCAIGATGARGATAGSEIVVAAGAFAATTALTEVVSTTSSGSDFVGCGVDFAWVGGADLVRSADVTASSGSMETDTFSPSRRMATVNTPTPAQS